MLKIAYNLIFNYPLFRPSAILKDFSQLQLLVQRDNIKFIVFDKDDTLVPLHQFQIRNKQVLRQKNILMIIVSNSIKDHHVVPDNINGVPILRTKDKKPQNGTQIWSYLINKNKSLKKDEVALVGDRVMTDIYLGNLLGAKSYLVKPLQQTTLKKHGFAVLIMRQIQNYMIKHIQICEI